MATFMLPKCASTSRGSKNVPTGRTVSSLILLLRSIIVTRNTRNISVSTTHTQSINVPTEIFVPTHTPKKKFYQLSSTITLRTKISTCFIIKQNSAPSILQNMILPSVYTLTTGKTIEDSPIISTTKLS